MLLTCQPGAGLTRARCRVGRTAQARGQGGSPAAARPSHAAATRPAAASSRGGQLTGGAAVDRAGVVNRGGSGRALRAARRWTVAAQVRCAVLCCCRAARAGRASVRCLEGSVLPAPCTRFVRGSPSPSPKASGRVVHQPTHRNHHQQSALLLPMPVRQNASSGANARHDSDLHFPSSVRRRQSVPSLAPSSGCGTPVP